MKINYRILCFFYNIYYSVGTSYNNKKIKESDFYFSPFGQIFSCDSVKQEIKSDRPYLEIMKIRKMTAKMLLPFIRENDVNAW